MRQKQIESIFLRSSKNKRSSEKLQNCICPLFDNECILATLLQNRVQCFKIFVISKVLNFVLFVPPLVWFSMDFQTSHSEVRDYARIFLLSLILWTFYVFFSNALMVSYCVLAEENPETFTERCSVMSAVLQGVAESSFTPKLQPWKVTFGRMSLYL